MIGACAAALVALAGLSACDTNAGAAAFVGGDRITEADVTKYLTPTSTPYSNSSGGEVRPKSLVLQTLIREQIFAKALAQHGGNPTASELARAKSSILQGSSDEQLTAQITQTGFAAAFEPVFVSSNEFGAIFAQRLGAQSDQDVINALNKLGIKVSVSPRYGQWNSTQLALQNGVDPGLSGVLTLPSTSSPPPSPAP
jgi:hypothetical protein